MVEREKAAAIMQHPTSTTLPGSMRHITTFPDNRHIKSGAQFIFLILETVIALKTLEV
jgi:hypothetical protein